MQSIPPENKIATLECVQATLSFKHDEHESLVYWTRFFTEFSKSVENSLIAFKTSSFLRRLSYNSSEETVASTIL